MTANEQAHELVTLAWADLDAAGQMRSWSRWNGTLADQMERAADLIDQAADEYEDRNGEAVGFCAIRRAQELLIVEADAFLAQEEAAP